MELIEVSTTDTMFDYKQVKIENERAILMIEFAGNLDLYWNYLPKNGDILHIDKGKFVVNKDDDVYSYFEELFECIKNSMPYANSVDDYPENNKVLYDWHSSKSLGLFKDNKVIWLSDDECEERASKLEIEKTDKSIVCTFYKGNPQYGFPSFFIRICNSGSRYCPFNATFMNMYKKIYLTN